MLTTVLPYQLVFDIPCCLQYRQAMGTVPVDMKNEENQGL